MDIGTGKDLSEYNIHGKQIPYHLIDICEPGSKFLLPDFQREFHASYKDLIKRNKKAILCGGTGLYIESVLENHQYTQIPENTSLRTQLKSVDHLDLIKKFKSLDKIEKFNPDISTKKRTIRAFEIHNHLINNTVISAPTVGCKTIIGLDITREERRKKISLRLKERMNEGLIEEVESLLDEGIKPEDLIYYGLEYKFVVEFLENKWSKEYLFEKLEVAIHQYAKRQMTWFRRMEKKGYGINWIDASASFEQNYKSIQNLITPIRS